MSDLPLKARRALRLTHLGLVAERAVQAFFPLWSLGFVLFGAALLGLPAAMSFEALWFGVVAAVAACLWAVWLGLRRFRWPSLEEATRRLDATLPGRPLAALGDDQAIGAEDAASEAVWAAHRRRMAEAANRAHRAEPDLRVARRDPYALRYMALLVVSLGVIFGSMARLGDAQLERGAAVASGPAWEGWVEPPAYTGRPALYLPDLT
ncbi:MAG: DUF4175 family protein, partial [Pseudomonadota bacterium]